MNEEEKNDLLHDKVVTGIQSLINECEAEGLMDRKDKKSMFLTDAAFTIGMECGDLNFDPLSEAVTGFVDAIHYPFQYHPESEDDIQVGLFNFELGIGKSEGWCHYMNQMIFKKGKHLPGFAPVWFHNDKSEWQDWCNVLLDGEMLPVEAIVDFRLLCVRWDKYSKPQSHQEYVCDYFRQNILTRGKNMEGFVPVCTGENGEDCALNFEDLLQKHPDLFQ